MYDLATVRIVETEPIGCTTCNGVGLTSAWLMLGCLPLCRQHLDEAKAAMQTALEAKR